MLVIRPVQLTDLEDIHRLAVLSGEGMTSLPTDRGALQHNIETAVASFARTESDPSDYFLMVLEDTDASRVVGTSAVYARTGARQAFYAYRLMSVTHYSHSLEKEIRSSLLHLTNDYTGYSELGTLFLDPAYRGNGHWLSRSRYLLLGMFPRRFADNVIAELRGWLDADGNSPFWQAIGRQFFDMSYSEADRLCGIGSNQFITELMPKYPIYTNLLPASALAVIGKPHTETRRAMELLLEEGFEYENLVDIFDGGPLVRARLDRLRSVEKLRYLTVTVSESDQTTDYLMATTHLTQLRIVYAPAVIENDTIGISAALAQQLGVTSGEKLAVVANQQEAL